MNKKILILGVLGFIGIYLIEELINRGDYKIIIFKAPFILYILNQLHL